MSRYAFAEHLPIALALNRCRFCNGCEAVELPLPKDVLMCREMSDLSRWNSSAAGCVTWLLGGATALRSLGIWFWFGAFGVLSLPLVVWLVHFIVKRGRD